MSYTKLKRPPNLMRSYSNSQVIHSDVSATKPKAGVSPQNSASQKSTADEATPVPAPVLIEYSPRVLNESVGKLESENSSYFPLSAEPELKSHFYQHKEMPRD